jgi:hypothetical protein
VRAKIIANIKRKLFGGQEINLESINYSHRVRNDKLPDGYGEHKYEILPTAEKGFFVVISNDTDGTFQVLTAFDKLNEAIKYAVDLRWRTYMDNIRHMNPGEGYIESLERRRANGEDVFVEAQMI